MRSDSLHGSAWCQWLLMYGVCSCSAAMMAVNHVLVYAPCSAASSPGVARAIELRRHMAHVIANVRLYIQVCMHARMLGAGPLWMLCIAERAHACTWHLLAPWRLPNSSTAALCHNGRCPPITTRSISCFMFGVWTSHHG